ncbi:MAG: hypothetical protein OEY91_13300 [Nitrospirota bacterium]|nr:hypothetical protein [Nitrospirota bacterium]
MSRPSLSRARPIASVSWASISHRVILAIGYRESLFILFVTPDIRYRESILVLSQMDPRRLLAGMTAGIGK